MPCPLTVPKPRQAALSFAPYVPGLSIDEIKEHYGLTSVIKLASNENPLGTSPLVQKTIVENASLAFRYPQSGVPKLQAAIARKHNLPEGMVAVGNGSDEIIDLLIRVLAEPGKNNVIAFDPCFSIYKLQAKISDIEFRQTPLNPDFTFPWNAFLATANANTAVAFITTPDNPSGYAPALTDLLYVASKLPATCLLVVDEAYMDFCDCEEAHSLLAHLQKIPNLAILRTFSKSYGLAGLRVGYGLMPETIAEVLRRVHLPFSVNLLAEKAALAALEDTVFYEETLRTVKIERPWLSSELTKLDCKVLPSQANFIMFKPPCPAGALFEKLLQKGIIVRPLKSYGLDDYLRLSIGTHHENQTLLAACKEILSNE